jgi:hypothetical protein
LARAPWPGIRCPLALFSSLRRTCRHHQNLRNVHRIQDADNRRS